MAYVFMHFILRVFFCYQQANCAGAHFLALNTFQLSHSCVIRDDKVKKIPIGGVARKMRWAEHVERTERE
jgi:hypothetical protein